MKDRSPRNTGSDIDEAYWKYKASQQSDRAPVWFGCTLFVMFGLLAGFIIWVLWTLFGV